ncbi:MAG: hypothetical protein RLZZ241_621 [Bacteroidota bacterium]|jgi:hypothetical protein
MRRLLTNTFRIVVVLTLVFLTTTCSKEDDTSCKDVIQGDFELVE